MILKYVTSYLSLFKISLSIFFCSLLFALFSLPHKNTFSVKCYNTNVYAKNTIIFIILYNHKIKYRTLVLFFAWFDVDNLKLICFSVFPAGCTTFNITGTPVDCLYNLWIKAGCLASGTQNPKTVLPTTLNRFNGRNLTYVLFLYLPFFKPGLHRLLKKIRVRIFIEIKGVTEICFNSDKYVEENLPCIWKYFFLQSTY